MLEEALKLDPKLDSAHESMGFLCTQQNKVEEANKWYSQAVALNSQSYLAHYYFATSLLRSKLDDDSVARAESSLRAAIKINPGFAPAYDALGWLLASGPENLEKAERLNEAHMMTLTAVALEPGNVHYRLNSAQVLERMGRADDAVNVADRAASMAKTPDEQAAVLAVLSSAQQYRNYQKQAKEQKEAAEKAQAELAASHTSETSHGNQPGPADTSAEISAGDNNGSDEAKPPVLRHGTEAITGLSSMSPPNIVAPEGTSNGTNSCPTAKWPKVLSKTASVLGHRLSNSH